MINRRSTVIIIVLLTCFNCFGQTTFQGITPGKSTRTQSERVFGKPLQSVSQTLVEYAPQAEADKVYVQYRDASPDAVVERIELTCTHDGWGMKTPNSLRCSRWSSIQEKYKVDLSLPDAFKKSDNPLKTTYYFGSPRFIVNSTKYLPGLLQTDSWAFYSRELFQNAVPERGCTGTVLGDWETNRGRMTVVRDGDAFLDDYGRFGQRFKGTYSQNQGTFSGTRSVGGGVFEWKDDTGSGTMWLSVSFNGDTVEGQWTRETGQGPVEGKLTGRCVEPN
jgi:hypothetical protein